MTTSVRVRMPTRKAREPGPFLLWAIFFSGVLFSLPRARRVRAIDTKRYPNERNDIASKKNNNKKIVAQADNIYEAGSCVRRNTSRGVRGGKGAKKKRGPPKRVILC